jgi:WhiB family redox-sensing transcriptional regulator
MPTGETERDYRRREMKEHLRSKLLTYKEPWMQDAKCAEVGGDIWYPEKGESTADAKRVCLECPVRLICLEWALERREKFGVFGGKSEQERRKILKERAA